MKKLFLLSLTCLFLYGCVASGVQVSQDAAMQFKEGKTTETEILAKLGRPTTTTISDGTRIISYTGFQSQVKAATFIPIIGSFVGGSDYTISTAMYQIDTKGVLQKITYSQSGSAARMGAVPVEPEKTEPRAVK